MNASTDNSEPLCGAREIDARPARDAVGKASGFQASNRLAEHEDKEGGMGWMRRARMRRVAHVRGRHRVTVRRTLWRRRPAANVFLLAWALNWRR